MNEQSSLTFTLIYDKIISIKDKSKAIIWQRFGNKKAYSLWNLYNTDNADNRQNDVHTNLYEKVLPVWSGSKSGKP